MEEVVFKGWSARTRSRQLNVGGEPKTEWSAWSYQSAWRQSNPYVYSGPGKTGAKPGVFLNPIQSFAGMPPQPGSFLKDEEYNAWRKEYNEWYDSRTIIGYWEYETQVVKTKIVIDED